MKRKIIYGSLVVIILLISLIGIKNISNGKPMEKVNPSNTELLDSTKVVMIQEVIIIGKK